ncbi:MAG: ABC transporter permease [Solobacterium sp.]|nr:ABC transporter permease [Solobacterium sp.]
MPKNTAAAEAEVKRRSMFQESMHRLVQNKLAMTGLFILVIITVLCLCAGIICPEGYDHQDVLNKFVGPCREYPFGTDSLGRSMLARILYGGRNSLKIGVMATAFSGVVGTVLGAVAGFYGGRVDNIIMRTLDIFSAIPNMLMAIAVSSALGGGLINCIIAIAISGTPQIARTVRAPILAVKEQEYVEAAREIDASDARIIFRHVLPNVLSPLIVTLTSQVAASILVATALSFLGLGIQPPEPEWGALISNSRQYIREYPFLVTFPGLAIALTVLSMNLFGDGLRDALDPKLKN